MLELETEIDEEEEIKEDPNIDVYINIFTSVQKVIKENNK